MKSDKQKISVFGDACTDVFVYGECSRLCSEAPVPILIPNFIEQNDGMALNVVKNIESLGILCHPITNDKKLITKKRFVEQSINQMLLRVDVEQKINPLDYDNISKEAFESMCAVVSDYDKGFISKECSQNISLNFSMSFLDTKKSLGKWAENFTFIKINEMEYLKTIDTITPNLQDKLIVTLGKKGCMFRGVVYPPPNIIQTVNVCGAGDTFLAGLVVEYIKSNDIIKSIKYALLCASDVVQRRGVTIPFKDKL